MEAIKFCSLVLVLFLSLLQTTLLVGKLLGHSTLTWWQTLLPLGAPALFALASVLTYVIVAWLLYLYHVTTNKTE